MITNSEIKTRAHKILDGMTIKEKIGQVTQMCFSGENYDEMVTAIKNIQPGSIILADSGLAGNEQQAEIKRDRLNRLQEIAIKETKNGIPLLFGRDVIHGYKVVFPNPLTMSASFNFELVRNCYDAIREEAVFDGIKWTFSPMIDLSRDPRWGRIIEGAGEDPLIGCCFAKAAVKGFQTDDLSSDGAVAACAKHFVGYGASEGGRDYSHTEIGDYLLQNYYLPSFRAAIDADVATVMSSFNDLNGIPMSANRYALTDILRGQMGFEGFVVSDWDAIRQMTAFSGFAKDNAHAAELGLHAGIDLDMADNCYLDNLEKLLEENRVTLEELDTAVLRILKVKLKMGLFERPIPERIAYDTEKHLELAKEMAEQSMVLLKNEKNILPLSKTAKIGLAGPFLHEKRDLVGSWALDTDDSLLETPFEAIKAVAPNAQLNIIPGNHADEIMFLRNSDCIVLFLGESRRVTGEANSISMPEISEGQRAIIHQASRTGKPIIGVLCYGRPIALGETKDWFDAIVYAGHGGSRASRAIAEVLFGDAEPSGRLSFTLPFSIGQIPLYHNVHSAARQINGYYDDENPHHRNYRDTVGTPAYPFGFGLGYTEFRYSDFKCEKESISLESLKNGEEFNFNLKLENVGKRTGSTVVQLYIKDIFASRLRPLRKLCKFQKISLPPDAEAQISMSLSYKDLGFYLENGDFIVEKGDFEIFIGESAYAEKRFKISVE